MTIQLPVQQAHEVCRCYLVRFSSSPSSIDEIYVLSFGCIKKSKMTHQQKPSRH